MTEKEKQKCKRMVKEGLGYAKSSLQYYAQYEKKKKECNLEGLELDLRWAEYYSGCAEGIYQTIVALGYNDETMDELGKQFPLC